MMRPALRTWVKRLGVAAAAFLAVIVLWVVVSVNSDSPVTYDDI